MFRKGLLLAATLALFAAAFFFLPAMMGFGGERVVSPSHELEDGGEAAPPQSGSENVGETPLLLSYCPTMEEVALELAEKHARITLKPEPSSSAALFSLSRGDADFALVGRPAKEYERGDGIKELRLEQGYGLIAGQSFSIHYPELANAIIHTYERAQSGAELLPSGTRVAVHKTLDDALLTNSMVLIDWRDYDGGSDFAAVLEPDGRKTRAFRSAVIYYREGNGIVEKFQNE